MLFNKPDLILELEAKEPLGRSDHNMIRFNLQIEREKVKLDVLVVQLSKGDYRGMMEELAKIDWKGALVGIKVEQQWREFLRIIRKMQEHFIPKRKKYSMRSG